MNAPDRVTNLMIPVAFASILAVIQGYAEEILAPPKPALHQGHADHVFHPPPSQPTRTHSVFTQARNRITDLLERKPSSIVFQFFDHFFHFLDTLLMQQHGDTYIKGRKRVHCASHRVFCTPAHSIFIPCVCHWMSSTTPCDYGGWAWLSTLLVLDKHNKFSLIM